MRYLLLIIFVSISCCANAQFSTEEKTLTTSTGELKGTLIFPKDVKHFSLMILQAGSGPTDRNGNNPLGVKANSYRLLAEALAADSIATLLIDKRGIGASQIAGKKEADLRFDDYANDLSAWFLEMKKDKRFSKIFLAGHSEGSLIAMIAAQQQNIAGYISLSGISQRIDKILFKQVSMQSVPLAQTMDSLLSRLRNDQKIDTVPVFLMSVLRPSIQPYMTSWMRHDPCEEIKKIKAPILILQGKNDIQVDATEALQLKECNPTAQLKIFDDMNHVLKAAVADRKKNLDTYTDETLPIYAGLPKAINDFIKNIKN